MALVNPTLQEAGPTPGSATGWKVASLCQAQQIAGFGPAPARSAEDFERWYELRGAFGVGSLVIAFFDAASQGYEDFTGGWTASAFLEAFSEALLDTCPFGGEQAEDLETGWLTAPFATAWAEVASARGLFEGADHEDFETWLAAGAAAFASASFDGATASAEAFEGPWSAMKTT
jgi:hypothetical protein